MRAWVHYLLMAWYLAGPVVGLVAAVVWTRRSRRWAPLMSYGLTVLSATVIAGALVMIYATAVQGRWTLGQLALATYFGLGMLLLLKGFDFMLRRLARWWVLRPPRAEPETWRRVGRLSTAAALRIAVLFTVGLPYVMASVMAYRPKVIPLDQPANPFEVVHFQATDGMPLTGWWIGAAEAPAEAGRQWGRRTLLVCHGLAANKENHLLMGEFALFHGYNVFIFDFRAHGESGGQLTTFGDRERYDVLGAVRWLRENRSDRIDRLQGIGASMGAAALIAAAADPSVEGQSIESVVVLGTFARLEQLARGMAEHYFHWPLDWLVRYVAVPMAEVQTNADLGSFAPADHVGRIWPRPILIIHGLRDEIIPFTQAEALFAAADQPKHSLWIERAGHNDVLRDRGAQEAILDFLANAAPLPIVSR